MNLTMAQPSAAARSRGDILLVQEDISQNRINAYQMQGNSMKAASTMTGAEATASRDGMNAAADSEYNEAVGTLDAGIFQAVGGGLMGGDEFLSTTGEYGTVSLGKKIDTLQANEDAINQMKAPTPLVKNVDAEAPAAKLEDAAADQKAKAVKDKKLADAKLDNTDLDTLQSDAELCTQTRNRIKSQKEELIRKRDDIQKGADGRRGTFQLLGQGIGQTLQGLRQTAAADQKRLQGAHQLESTLYKYVGDTDNRMSEMDGQVCQSLTSAQDALTQNLEAIVRSNQPN